MALEIRSLTVTCSPKTELVTALVGHLADAGYQPLIFRAKERYAEVFGTTPRDKSAREGLSSDRVLEYAYRQRALRYREAFAFTVAGDIFYTPSGKGVLYVALNIADSPFPHTAQEEARTRLEVGFIGDNEDAASLAALIDILTPRLQEAGITDPWSAVEATNPQFTEMAQSEENRFIPASETLQEDRRIAHVLQDQSTRDFAVLVKRSGGILTADISKRAAAIDPKELERAVQRLSEAGLVSNEHVVICKKTSNQVNRIDNREKIDRMAEMGILCSCGNPIAQERIEELISPTAHLVRLLNQSYWMSTLLVDTLSASGIPESRVILNLLEGGLRKSMPSSTWKAP